MSTRPHAGRIIVEVQFQFYDRYTHLWPTVLSYQHIHPPSKIGNTYPQLLFRLIRHEYTGSMLQPHNIIAKLLLTCFSKVHC